MGTAKKTTIKIMKKRTAKNPSHGDMIAKGYHVLKIPLQIQGEALEEKLRLKEAVKVKIGDKTIFYVKNK